MWRGGECVPLIYNPLVWLEVNAHAYVVFEMQYVNIS
jgi:hypothetical protein